MLLEQNKSETVMHLVGFTIEIYYDAWPYERQNCMIKCLMFTVEGTTYCGLKHP